MSAPRASAWSGGFGRTRAMLIKEFIQLRRDRISFAMIILVPLMQLLLFGYAINTTPRDLPTAVLLQESSDVGRSILKAFENTKYFKITRQVHDSISDKTTLLEEYGYGNRLVAVRGGRTSIADYEKGELVEIDRLRAEELALSEREQPLRERDRPLGRDLDRGERLPSLPGRNFAARDLRVA